MLTAAPYMTELAVHYHFQARPAQGHLQVMQSKQVYELVRQ